MEKMTSESQMTLVEYYKSLPKPIPPKTDFVRRISSRCGVDVGGVRNWMSGRNKPSEQAYIDILVEETGIAAENLFK